MKIIMLGNSSVGKTTYMASLYGIMQQKIDGFSLKAANNSDHNEWLNLAQAIANNNYPPSTNQKAEYDFFLQYQGNNIFAFRWFDYRGRAIREKQDSSEAKFLVENLKEADGIIMFCDSEALTNQNRKANEIRRMTVLINQVLQSLERPMYISIILSKVDKISRYDEKLVSPLSSLIDIINANQWTTAGIIPVACGHSFMNVSSPFLFTLYGGVYVQAYILQYLAQEKYQEAATSWEQSKGVGGFLRGIKATWDGKTTDKELATQKYAEAQAYAEKLEFIKEPVEALYKYIERIPMIEPGKNLRHYVQGCENLRIYQQLAMSTTQKVRSSGGSGDPFDLFF